MKRRDGKYMAGIMNQIAREWKENPDLRLAQLIANATHNVTGGFDCFYLEDDELIAALELFSGRMRLVAEMRKAREGK